MDKWVTVLTTTLPQQLWIIRGRLESEGIECFIKDELTVQSYNLYSNAVGGVKLQVLEKDQQRAVEILIELGYLKDEPVRPDLLTLVDQKTSNFFLLNKLAVTKRIIVLLFLGSLILGTILYFIFKPDIYEELTSTAWCVSNIYFNNKLIEPKTEDAFYLNFVDRNGNTINCETLDIRQNHDIRLPGINSHSVDGYWKLIDNETMVINADSIKTIYNGIYSINVSYSQLTLKSGTTTIYASRLSF